MIDIFDEDFEDVYKRSAETWGPTDGRTSAVKSAPTSRNVGDDAPTPNLFADVMNVLYGCGLGQELEKRPPVYHYLRWLLGPEDFR